MVCIGKEITEELECVPAKFFIRRYIRYKYVPKDKEKAGVYIGTLPERVIEKGIPGSGLLASILVDKYMDHLPLYRQRQRFLREKIPITSSTLEGWVKKGLERIEVLYEHLLKDTKSKGYLQVDETPIPVLESNKKGKTHQGYYWVYHSPIDQTVLFNYQPSRASEGPAGILTGFKGYLQTDGYEVYTKIVKDPKRAEKITHLCCWAHARRHFEHAIDNDKQRATIALELIQKLYQVEAQARNEGLTPMQRKELRLAESLPVINKLGKWISEEVKNTLPKSQIGKAMSYAIARWTELSAYLSDGMLEIDNNLVENAIRPVALGRKNYLFAGSHESAHRAAMIYSFFAMCKYHQVNPYEWLKYTLENIMIIDHRNVRDLYPQNFKLKSNM
jgi:transposase